MMRRVLIITKNLSRNLQEKATSALAVTLERYADLWPDAVYHAEATTQPLDARWMLANRHRWTFWHLSAYWAAAVNATLIKDLAIRPATERSHFNRHACNSSICIARQATAKQRLVHYIIDSNKNSLVKINNNISLIIRRRRKRRKRRWW